jgi:hypothetical protein
MRFRKRRQCKWKKDKGKGRWTKKMKKNGNTREKIRNEGERQKT